MQVVVKKGNGWSESTGTSEKVVVVQSAGFNTEIDSDRAADSGKRSSNVTNESIYERVD